jgi:poly(3-hydroxybutyrate) depolymerase
MDALRLRVEDGPLRYLVAVPPAQQPAGHPVLCFLHGYDEGAPLPMQDALTRHGPLRSGNAVHAIEEFLIVAPQLPTRGDLWHQYADAVRAILTQVRQHHAGDPQRTYLTGFSFGGNGVFDLALRQPDTWAALWAVDPTRVPARDPQRPVWLSVGAAARPRTAGFIRALALRPPGKHTDAERVYLDEGADHVGAATRAYQDERIYAWLLSKRLGGLCRKFCLRGHEGAVAPL